MFSVEQNSDVISNWVSLKKLLGFILKAIDMIKLMCIMF